MLLLVASLLVSTSTIDVFDRVLDRVTAHTIGKVLSGLSQQANGFAVQVSNRGNDEDDADSDADEEDADEVSGELKATPPPGDGIPGIKPGTVPKG